jgi:hypothetical protein
LEYQSSLGSISSGRYSREPTGSLPMMQTLPQEKRLWMQRTANGRSWSQETFSRGYGSGLHRWTRRLIYAGFTYAYGRIYTLAWVWSERSFANALHRDIPNSQ